VCSHWKNIPYSHADFKLWSLPVWKTDGTHKYPVKSTGNVWNWVLCFNVFIKKCNVFNMKYRHQMLMQSRLKMSKTKQTTGFLKLHNFTVRYVIFQNFWALIIWKHHLFHVIKFIEELHICPIPNAVKTYTCETRNMHKTLVGNLMIATWKNKAHRGHYNALFLLNINRWWCMIFTSSQLFLTPINDFL
jgi:hypothetical protein